MVAKHTRRLTKWGLLSSLFLLLLLQSAPLGQTDVDSSRSIQVLPGQSIRRDLSTGKEDTFAVLMESQRLVHFSIIKGDLAVTTEVYDSSGTKVLEYVSRRYEVIESSLVAEISGTYKIVIRSLETSESPRAYELRLQPLKVLTRQGRAEHEAQKLIASATILRAQWTRTSLHQAIEKYDKAALIWKAEGNSSGAARALMEAGEVCFLLSEYNNALKRYQTASQLIATADDELTASRILSHIGLIWSYLGNNDEAQVNLANALRFLESADEAKEGPLVRHALAEALSNLGEITYSKGNLVRSLTQFERAGKIFAEIGDRNGQAHVHLSSGYVNGSLGEPQKAISEIDAALKLFREVTNKAGEGRALTASGLVSSLKRDEDGAIDLHRAALEIFQTIGDRHSEAITLNALGQAYENLSEYSIALDYYQESLAISEKIRALDAASVTMCKVAAAYRLGANLDQALAHYQRCIDMSRAARKVRTEAIALEEVGTIYAAQGHVEQTQQQFEKLQKFYERLGDIRGQASALNSLGNSFLSLGERQKAFDAYSRALPLSEKTGDTGAVVSTLYNLARVARDLGSLETALAYVDRSLKLVEDIRRNVASPDFRASYFSGIHKHYDLRVDILMQLDRAQPGKGFSEAAFLTSENARARSLLDLLTETRANLRGTVAPELLNREHELQGLLHAQAQYLMDLSMQEHDYREMAQVNAEIERLRSEYLELQSRITEQAHQHFALADPSSLQLEQIQKELRNRDTILLEFSLGEVRSYVWVVTQDSCRGYELPAAQILREQSMEVYKLLTARQDVAKLKGDDYAAKVDAADNLYFEKAARLSETLLGQLTEPLNKSSRVVLVTDGPLQYISFEALPIPQEMRNGLALGSADRPPFLIASHEIVRLPSISTLMAIRNAARSLPASDSVVAVFADPVFSREDERVNKEPSGSGTAASASSSPESNSELPVLNGLASSAGLVRLGHTANEASAIVAMTPRGTALVAEGFDASRETAMSPPVGQFQIVHFATHSFLNNDHPELSGLVLTMVDARGAKKNGLMLLSDIYSLKLSAELTVLSGCETALGKDLDGEGLVGLTHSFLSAGSKSIVASLWKIDDRATAMLMSDFYQSMLQSGMAPAAALRAAKLKLMKEQRWAAPYYWAGFVFQGEYENHIVVSRNISRRPSLILFQALLLIVAGFVVYIGYRRLKAKPV